MLYSCDHAWWQFYFSELATVFRGAELWTITNAARDQYKLHWIYAHPKPTFEFNESSIDAGLNSGYQAVGLARLFGAKRILLLGYDFQRTGGRNHWHPDHPRNMGNGGDMPEWVKEMGRLAPRLEKLGVEVVNCTRKTALQCFRRSSIQQELPAE